MIGFLRKFIKDRRGNVLVIAGAALPMIVGAAGLATDTIQWTLWKRQLQRAADSAAIAGAYERQAGKGATTGVEDAVKHDVTINLHTVMDASSTNVSFPANAGSATNQVEVTLTVQQRLPFSSMFMQAAPVISATARAATVPAGGDPCFHALEEAAATGLNFTGNAAIEAPDCDGFSNAAGSNTSVAKGSAIVKLNSIGGVGGIQESNNFQVTAYRPYSPSLDDPFEKVNPDPAEMKCAGHFETHKIKGTPTKVWVYDALTDGMNPADAKWLDADGVEQPGANCWTGLSVASLQSLNVPSNFGPIYINGGNADFQGDFSCTGCTIVLTNKDAASPIGTISANADADINITAPTSGTYKGIAIYQDRRAKDCNKCNKVNGNSASIIQGALYFPSQELVYNGTGTTAAICTMFVARRLDFSGNSATSNKFKKLADCSAFGLPNGTSSQMVRLVA